MGGQQSNFVKAHKALDRQDSTVSDDCVDISDAEDMLIDILSFVPFEDLIHNCCLVCKQWKDLIDGHSVWKRKCDHENIKPPLPKLGKIPEHYYRNIYLHEKFKGNLLKNPCGEDKCQDWEVWEAGGDGFVIENPPKGADPVPEVVGSQSCFATSFHDCRKSQIVDLYEKKFNKFLVGHNIVKIQVGEWYVARFDCASDYELKVLLFDEQENELDKFEFKFTEEQWIGKEWHLVSHEFSDVSKARYLHFEHMGKDNQFWAGHYGSKFTGAFVKLCLK